jgi:hypothetical protein
MASTSPPARIASDISGCAAGRGEGGWHLRSRPVNRGCLGDCPVRRACPKASPKEACAARLAAPLFQRRTVTALETGEINLPDWLADIVVGVAGAECPAALLFEGPDGPLRCRPEVLGLPPR